MGRGRSLHGRDVVVARCAALLEAGGDAAGVVIAGPPGSGTTSVGSHVADVVGGSGGAKAVLRAMPGTVGIPLGCAAPLLELLDVEPGDPMVVLAAVHRRLAEIASDREMRPLVLVDDAHHLDPVGAALMGQLVDRGDATVVLTIHSGSPCPPEVSAVWTTGRCQRVDLEPLDVEAVAAIAADVLGGPVARSTASALQRSCGGLPLLVRELLAEAQAADRISHHGGLWHWQGVAAGPRLSDLAAARLAAHAPETRDAFDLLSVATALPLDAALSLCGDAPLLALETDGLVVVDEEERRVSVKPPLLADVRRLGLGELKLELLRNRVADALEQAGSDHPADVLTVVRRALDRGDPVSSERLVGACTLARSLGDPVDAEALARAAVAAGAGSRGELVLAETLESMARHREAWELVRDLDVRLDDPELIARARACAVRVASHGLHDPQVAAAILDGRPPIADPTWQSYVEAQWVTTQVMIGEAASARERCDRLLEHPDPVVRLRALPAANLVDVTDGQLLVALDRARDLMPVAIDVLDEFPTGGALVVSAMLLDSLLAGLHDETESVLDFVESYVSSSLPAYRAFTLSARSRLALQRGDVEAARVAASESAALFVDGSDDQGFLPFVLGVLCASSAIVGDNTGADDAAAEALRLVERSEPRMLHLEVARLVAWAPLGHNDSAAAMRGLVAAADRAHELHQRTFELLALHDAVRFGAPRAVQRRTVSLARHVEGPFAEAAGAHAAALVARDASGLERAADAFASMGSRLVAAELFGSASRQYAEDGVTAGVRRCGAAATRLRRTLGEVYTPALNVAVDAPALSARELQVSRLAAAGATSREIADDLQVSKRTVDNLLGRAYTKLGIAGRSELARALDDDR